MPRDDAQHAAQPRVIASRASARDAPAAGAVPSPSPPRAPAAGGELIAAPVRWPRPSRLEAPLQAPPRKTARRRCRRSACDTVGDLLEHLPSGQPRGAHGGGAARRRAGDGGGAGASDRRARRCAGAGCARWWRRRCSTRPGTMRATFFNQPWLVERYPPGTRLLLHGKADARGGFRVSHHAPGDAEHGSTRAGARARRGRPLPGRGGRHLDADPHARAGRAGRARRRHRAAVRRRSASPSGCPTAPAALAAMHFPQQPAGLRDRPRAARVRGAAADPAGVPAPPRRAQGAHAARAVLADDADAERALAERRAAVRADGRPAPGDRRDRRGSGAAARRCSGC